MAFGNDVRIPALGDPGLAGRHMKFAQVVVVAGDSDGVPASSSDADADLFSDTQEAELEIFNIEAGADDFIWVVSVVPVVVTAFTAAVNLDAGDTDDVNGWFTEVACGATTTDQGILATVTNSDDIAYMEVGGRYFATSSGTIELVTTGADIVVGRLAVFAQYARVNHGGA